jgi:DNA-directed RNA polymerase subunit beta
MEPGVPESFKVLIKELQSLALDVKVLTENREEIEIKIQDDDMAETAKDIGLLVGDEDPRMSQTAQAAREAEHQRVAAAAVPAGIGLEDVAEGATVAEGDEAEEDDDTEASDEEVAAAQASPRSAMPASPELDSDTGLGRIGGLGDDVLDADVLEEEPAAEEEEIDEGYVLEDEEEELETEEEEDEGLGSLGPDEDY